MKIHGRVGTSGHTVQQEATLRVCAQTPAVLVLHQIVAFFSTP